MARTHFVTDREMPQLSTEVTFVRALCRDRIKDPVRLHVWDSLPIGTKLDLSEFNTLTDCQDCLLELQKTEGRVTIFAVRSKDRGKE